MPSRVENLLADRAGNIYFKKVDVYDSHQSFGVSYAGSNVNRIFVPWFASCAPRVWPHVLLGLDFNDTRALSIHSSNSFKQKKNDTIEGAWMVVVDVYGENGDCDLKCIIFDATKIRKHTHIHYTYLYRFC